MDCIIAGMFSIFLLILAAICVISTTRYIYFGQFQYKTQRDLRIADNILITTDTIILCVILSLLI